MNVALKEALSKLQPDNDNHWTADGLPRLETIRMLVGNPTLSRADITAEFPNFNRKDTSFESIPEPEEVEEEVEEIEDEEANLKKLAYEKAQLEQRLEQLTKEYTEAGKAVAECTAELDQIISYLEAERIRLEPPLIDQYKAHQANVLAQRANTIKMVADSGIALRELAKSLKAPIDANRVGKRIKA